MGYSQLKVCVDISSDLENGQPHTDRFPFPGWLGIYREESDQPHTDFSLLPGIPFS
jgi:hypothetical protein